MGWWLEFRGVLLRSVNGSTTAAAGTVSYTAATGVATLSGYGHGLNASTTAYSIRAVFTSSNTNYDGNEATNASALMVGKANQAPLTVTNPPTGTYGQAYDIITSGGTGTGDLSFAVTGTACTM